MRAGVAPRKRVGTFAVPQRSRAMSPLPCPNCARLLHFEARICPNCRFTLGYCPDAEGFLFLGDNLTTWRDAAGEAHDDVVCANNDAHGVCNWLVPRNDPVGFCRACRHNRTIPDLSVAGVPERWGKIEAAKRRLFDTLIRLGLPLETAADVRRPGTGQALAFDFLYDPDGEARGKARVITGHDGGVVTLNLIEADDVERERIRRRMGEPYRTLLGHFRHEVGHHFWARLVENDADELAAFRALFGDERTDYSAALSRHYGGGRAWTTDHVSVYATAHPWEDFAETFAHLLHMIDGLATLAGFAVTMRALPGHGDAAVTVAFDPYRASTADLVGAWVPFSFAENAIARSMGQPDLYPFHLSERIVEKLDFANRIVTKARGSA